MCLSMFLVSFCTLKSRQTLSINWFYFLYWHMHMCTLRYIKDTLRPLRCCVFYVTLHSIFVLNRLNLQVDFNRLLEKSEYVLSAFYIICFMVGMWSLLELDQGGAILVTFVSVLYTLGWCHFLVVMGMKWCRKWLGFSSTAPIFFLRVCKVNCKLVYACGNGTKISIWRLSNTHFACTGNRKTWETSEKPMDWLFGVLLFCWFWWFWFGFCFNIEAAFSDFVFSTFEESLESLWLFPMHMPWCFGKKSKVVLHPFKCLDSHLNSVNDRNQNSEATWQRRRLARQNADSLSVSSCW